ncbi:SLATT domain-containing protein [Amycolatopsis balhimycina]|uniref:SLATT domain-containing protein n=1 Tax=Amycolatopsis balhimycina TaxID=208443 RepID=UPI00036430AA|nr:SLATT domain-containing protein [Amycolatopsis balhimycina]
MLKSAPPTVLTARVGAALDPSLTTLREAELQDRRKVYLRDRITDQAAWYAGKSNRNRKAASRWRAMLVLTEAVGVAGALLRATGAVDLDIAGIVAAVAGAGVAWLALKRYEQLAQSYAYATNELAIIEGRITLATEEGTWASAVAEAEETIGREHLAWRASRTTIAN